MKRANTFVRNDHVVGACGHPTDIIPHEAHENGSGHAAAVELASLILPFPFSPDAVLSGHKAGADRQTPPAAQDGSLADAVLSGQATVANGQRVLAVRDGSLADAVLSGQRKSACSQEVFAAQDGSLADVVLSGQAMVARGQRADAAQDGSLADVIAALQELQVRRRHHIRTSTRITNAAGALVRRALGWTPDNPDAEKIVRRAKHIVAAFLAGKNLTDDILLAEALAVDLGVARVQIKISHAVERSIVSKMERMGRTFPAYAFAKSVLGFGDLGFAVLVAEAGDLSRYSKVDKLWSRLGLSPYEGHALSNWRKKGGLSSEEWDRLGYKPQRRAEIFGVIEDPLFRIQASRNGPYHAVYLARRERTAETHPEWTKGHSHDDAKRVMVKKLIADTWSAWRQAIRGMPDGATETLPAAELIVDAPVKRGGRRTALPLPERAVSLVSSAQSDAPRQAGRAEDRCSNAREKATWRFILRPIRCPA
jgi:hypothetical protein